MICLALRKVRKIVLTSTSSNWKVFSVQTALSSSAYSVCRMSLTGSLLFSLGGTASVQCSLSMVEFCAGFFPCYFFKKWVCEKQNSIKKVYYLLKSEDS